jgi:hypothetical protein
MAVKHSAMTVRVKRGQSSVKRERQGEREREIDTRVTIEASSATLLLCDSELRTMKILMGFVCVRV